MAAALIHHEPGWRLPRHSALARRYNVSTAEVDAAIAELAARRLIRRLPDGQAYRASPAEYLIPLEGIPGLAAHLDPMGGDIACRSRQVSLRRVPEDISWALGVSPAEPVCMIRFLWTADGQPAAYATTYLARRAAGPYLASLDESEAVADESQASLDEADEPGPAAESGGPGGLIPEPRPAPVGLLPLTAPMLAGPASQPDQAGTPDGAAASPPGGRPGALFVELQPPPPSVARSLRLTPGQLAAMVTIRFDDPFTAEPLALTVAICRPDLFRIVVAGDSPPAANGASGSFSGIWTHAVQDWKP
jgi:hypothetical protein